MPSPGLVSVVTGTWKRHDLLRACVEQVRAQTYRPIEHCIVSDGPDPELREVIARLRADRTDVPIEFVELGRNWSSFLTLSFSAAPFQVAQWLTSGDMLMWLSDDQLITPNHVEKLVDLMECEQADFVYPVHGFYLAGDRRKTLRVAGYDPPRQGQISHALYRVELLDYMGFVPHVGCETDWHQIQAWMAAGARWAMLPERTFTHRIDRVGDAGQPRGRLLLRGHEEAR